MAWSEGDQDKALAWQRLQRSRCSGCGTVREDWEHDKEAYVGWHDRCPGCAELERERNDVEDAGLKGARVYLLPRETALRLIDEGHDDLTE